MKYICLLSCSLGIADLLLTHDDAGIEEPGRLNGRSGDNSGVPAPVAALRDFRNVSDKVCDQGGK